MENFSLKSIRGCSGYNTITKILIEGTVEWILSHPNVKLQCVLSDVVAVLNLETNV